MQTQPSRLADIGRFSDYYVTTRYHAPGLVSRREPSGTQHLRRLGDFETACAVWAVEWPMYFDLRIDVRSPDLCRECARGLGLRP